MKQLVLLTLSILPALSFSQKVRKIYYADLTQRSKSIYRDENNGNDYSYVTKTIYRDEIEEIYWDKELTKIKSRTKRRNFNWYYSIGYFMNGKIQYETHYDTINEQYTYPSVWYGQNGFKQKEIIKIKDTIFHKIYNKKGITEVISAYSIPITRMYLEAIGLVYHKPFYKKKFHPSGKIWNIQKYEIKETDITIHWTSFFEDGKIWSKSTTLNGHYINEYLYYHSNGQLWVKTEYASYLQEPKYEGADQSIKHGYDIEYTDKGTIVKMEKYENGKLVKR